MKLFKSIVKHAPSVVRTIGNIASVLPFTEG